MMPNLWIFRLFVLSGALSIVGCNSETADMRSKQTRAFIMIDAGSADAAWSALARINGGLPKVDLERIKTQGHFDETPRVIMEFVGDCSSRAAFVSDVRRLASAQGVRDVTCTATLPTG